MVKKTHFNLSLSAKESEASKSLVNISDFSPIKLAEPIECAAWMKNIPSTHENCKIHLVPVMLLLRNVSS